jgi:CHAT domain-containing protein
MAVSNLSVVGSKLEFSESENPGLVQSFQISGNSRSNTESFPIDNPKDKIYHFEFEDGTTWVCEYEKFGDLFPEKNNKGRSIDGDFQIPDGLVDDTQTRTGVFGKIALKFLNIFAKEAVKVGVKELAIKYEKKHLDDQSGLYLIDGTFELKKVEAANLIPSASYILFIHGTFSSTKGSFGELFNTDLWKQITEKYPDKILAFQHETVTKSPLQNVVDLVKNLPNEISLNIVSHSRGGLVGDILSKYANKQPFTDSNLKLLENEGGRESDIDAIVKLNTLFKDKNIKVERFIRVCCPASGTKLAGARIGNFVNIILNLIGIANPIFSFVKELLVEIIKTKDNINVLPGLEAMNPDSPFIKILNDPTQGLEIDDNLIVLSASAKAQVNLKGLLIILTRLGFGQRNDLVVNSDSMYLGAKRKNEIQYFFDESNTVTHVTIFQKIETQKRLSLIFETAPGQQLIDFKRFSQAQIPDSDRNINLNKIIPNGRIKNRIDKSEKPILILIPGIMGSTLGKNDEDIWLNYGKFLTGGLYDLKIEAQEISSSGIVKSAYSRLYEKFSQKYEVETFSYDWRKSLTETAQIFNDRIIDLMKLDQPIKVVAHSMGGVLFRDFVINHNDTWQKLNKKRGFKIVYLGTPFRGSMRMASVFMGQDGLIKTLAKIDLIHTKNNLLNVFNKYPGIYCLLPLENEEDFANKSLWEKLSDASESPKPPIPEEADLNNYKAYRDKILSKIDSIDYSNMIYIAGKGNKTDESFFLRQNLDGSKTLVFTSTADGDESVTWKTGIPKAIIDSKSVYYTQVVHGELANEPKIFEAIEELLEFGATQKLDRTPANLRSTRFNTESSYDRSFDLSPKGVEASLLGLSDEKFEAENDEFLSISITKGDLKYAQYPIFAGHFKNDGILNAEKAIDSYLNGILSIRNELGLYPEEIGENELFISESNSVKSLFDFNGAIIVGLGKIGELSRPTLTQTVESAAVRYLLDLNNKNLAGIEQSIGISSLFISSGYGGLTIDASASSIIAGIHSANSKIKSYFPTNTIQINRIEFIERYDDIALSAFIQLFKAQADLKIVFPRKGIDSSPGNRSRIVLENTAEWWNRITVVEREKEKATDLPQMSFSLSSKKASEDKRQVYSKTDTLDNLLSIISKEKQWDEKIAHTIYELMIPNDFKENLKNKGHIAWIVDETTAKYPWELLKDKNDKKPLSINAGMVRQLSTGNSIKNVNYVSGKNALVIADPDLEGFVNQLPGALKEGTLVSQIFNNQGYECKTLLKSKSIEILTSILPNNCKIIHLAGHGVFDELNPSDSGMLIGNNKFLTTAEITQMTDIPEFVFINCCYLGEYNEKAEKFSQNRYKFAANIGTALIEMGVKAVIAGGWEVNDSSALKFASVFYESMFAGVNFGESVLKARRAIYHPNDNTWGAYQCYGDPFYTITNSNWKNNGTYSFILPDEAYHTLNNIKNDLETGRMDNQYILETLDAIADAVKKAGVNNNLITELEALIYSEIGEYGLSCVKYEQLLMSENADFSLKSVEKYHNILTKKCVVLFEKKKTDEKDLVPLLDKAIKNFKALIDITPTSERYSYLGSAYKRKAYIIADKVEKLECYKNALENYQKADKLKEDVYPFANWATLEILLNGKTNPKITKLNEKHLNSTDGGQGYSNFWSLVKKNNLMMVDFIADTRAEATQIIKDYKEIWEFTGSKGKKIAELEHLKILIDLANLQNDAKRMEKLNGVLDGLGVGWMD